MAAGVKREEVGFQLAFSKTELRKVIKEYPGKEVSVVTTVMVEEGGGRGSWVEVWGWKIWMFESNSYVLYISVRKKSLLFSTMYASLRSVNYSS